MDFPHKPLGSKKTGPNPTCVMSYMGDTKHPPVCQLPVPPVPLSLFWLLEDGCVEPCFDVKKHLVGLGKQWNNKETYQSYLLLLSVVNVMTMGILQARWKWESSRNNVPVRIILLHGLILTWIALRPINQPGQIKKNTCKQQKIISTIPLKRTQFRNEVTVIHPSVERRFQKERGLLGGG